MALVPFGWLVVGIVSPQESTAAPFAVAPTRAGIVRRYEDVESRDAQLMLAAVNRERLAYGLVPLRRDEQLTTLATDHALDMAARNYFSHDTPEGLSPFDRMDEAGYEFEYAAENMALDQNPAAADEALWNSPGHRDNTLGPQYRRIGIAAVQTDDGELFVEDFSD